MVNEARLKRQIEIDYFKQLGEEKKKNGKTNNNSIFSSIDSNDTGCFCNNGCY